MLTVILTSSAGTSLYQIASPITDEIHVLYNDCKYCGQPTRRDKFCCDYHKVVYCRKRIGDVESNARALALTVAYPS